MRRLTAAMRVDRAGHGGSAGSGARGARAAATPTAALGRAARIERRSRRALARRDRLGPPPALAYARGRAWAWQTSRSHAFYNAIRCKISRRGPGRARATRGPEVHLVKSSVLDEFKTGAYAPFFETSGTRPSSGDEQRLAAISTSLEGGGARLRVGFLFLPTPSRPRRTSCL